MRGDYISFSSMYSERWKIDIFRKSVASGTAFTDREKAVLFDIIIKGFPDLSEMSELGRSIVYRCAIDHGGIRSWSIPICLILQEIDIQDMYKFSESYCYYGKLGGFR